MAYNRSHARALLTADELDLFVGSLADGIGALTVEELKDRLARTRRLRDKQRDLFQRQRLDTRTRTGTKEGPSGVANQRTRQKAQLLDEALVRYQKRIDLLAEREAAAARRANARRLAEAARAAKRSRGKPGPAAARSAKARAGLPADTREPLPEKHRQMGRARTAKIRGSVSQSVRKAQARRDKR